MRENCLIYLLSANYVNLRRIKMILIAEENMTTMLPHKDKQTKKKKKKNLLQYVFMPRQTPK